jgi:hypothetical protein
VRVPSPNIKGTDHCVFSFKYWRQIPDFGLGTAKGSKGTIDPAWLVSALERLRDLESQPLDKLSTDNNDLRTHAISWTARNVPLTRSDLGWLPKQVKDNDAEFPLRQFHVSLAMGRIVGFVNGNTFFIVLLDPLHNLQPCKMHNYEVRACHPLDSVLETVLYKLKKENIPEHIINEARNGLSDEFVVQPLHRTTFAYVTEVLGKDDETLIAHLLEFDEWLKTKQANGSADSGSLPTAATGQSGVN